MEDDKTINISMSRSEIADMAGTTTESAIRTLAQLSDEKIIQLDGKNISILDKNKLLIAANTLD